LEELGRVLLYAIVRGLALTRISPNVLTFLGLVINTIAAILFGYANTTNFGRCSHMPDW